MEVTPRPLAAQSLVIIEDDNPDNQPVGVALTQSKLVIGFTKRRGKKNQVASGGTSMAEDSFKIGDYKAQEAVVDAGYRCDHADVIPGLDVDFCPHCCGDNNPGGTYFIDADAFKFSLMAKKAGLGIQSGTPSTPDIYEILDDLNTKTTEELDTHTQPSLFSQYKAAKKK